MIRAMRQVLPPTWALALFALFYLLCYVPTLLQYVFLSCVDGQTLNIPRNLVLIACFAYGLYRILAFHPVWRPTYKKWLQASPWTARLPLPLGPIHLVWQDVVVMLLAVILVLWPLVSVVMLVAERLVWWPPVFSTMLPPLTLPPLLMLLSYLAALALLFLITGLPRTGCCILIGLGTLVHLTERPGWSLIVIVGLYLVAYIALRRSLQLFPWDQAKFSDLAEKVHKALTQPNQPATTPLTWPFNRLQPLDPQPMVPFEMAVWISLVTGWYVHVLLIFALNLSAPDRDFVVNMLFIIGVIIVPGVRVLVYCVGYWPPISILGRIFTLRWIIPGYDRVFVSPICAMVGGIAVLHVPYLLGTADHVVVPVAIGVTLLLTLSLGPTLGSWRLTGSHRLAPDLICGNLYVKI